MNYWLLKSEPGTFSWDDMVRIKKDHWDGVRNYQARNYILKMKPDDRAFFYHSGKEKAIVGLVRIVSDPYPDPTTDDKQWFVVDVAAESPLAPPLTLSQIRGNSDLSDMVLLSNARLSVQPVTAQQYHLIMSLISNT